MKTRKVHTVLYDSDRRDGLSDDLRRFHQLQNAIAFAGRVKHYGQPAQVQTEDVPARIADRWSYGD